MRVDEPLFLRTTCGVNVFAQYKAALTGDIIAEILASKVTDAVLTGTHQFDEAKIFQGALFTTASIRATCCVENIYIQASAE